MSTSVKNPPYIIKLLIHLSQNWQNIDKICKSEINHNSVKFSGKTYIRYLPFYQSLNLYKKQVVQVIIKVKAVFLSTSLLFW